MWIKNTKPADGKPIWIQTFQGHINLAWYVQGEYWPYGGDIHDGRKPFEGVGFWKHAELPDGIEDGQIYQAG